MGGGGFGVGLGIINGQIGFGQFQLEQIGRAGQMQCARFGQLARALFDDVGDVFAAVGLVLVGVLDGPGDFFQAVDFDQGEDFLDVMAGVKPALEELCAGFVGLVGFAPVAGEFAG